jgi:hypothetical protein
MTEAGRSLNAPSLKCPGQPIEGMVVGAEEGQVARDRVSSYAQINFRRRSALPWAMRSLSAALTGS